jgi:hypothetical protein
MRGLCPPDSTLISRGSAYRDIAVGQALLTDGRCLLSQISPSDLDIAIVGKLTAAQFSLHDHLKPHALEMECLHAPLGCRTLVE